jgi:hypothetical protein
VCVSLEKYFRLPNLLVLASSFVVSLPELNAKVLPGIEPESPAGCDIDSRLTINPLFGKSELESI